MRGVDRDHTANHPLFVEGTVPVHHSPTEGFQSEVYTDHDPATGKRLWQQSLGHGYLLGQKGNSLIFDARDWHNLLDDQGHFRLAEVDAHTGKRQNFSRSLAALPGKLGLWTVTAGTPANRRGRYPLAGRGGPQRGRHAAGAGDPGHRA